MVYGEDNKDVDKQQNIVTFLKRLSDNEMLKCNKSFNRGYYVLDEGSKGL